MRVVVADDDEGMRLLIADRFRALGHEVFTAADGEEAILLVSEARPEFLVTDLRMPRASGIYVIKTARELAPGIKTVLMSVGLLETTEAAGREACADRAVPKTFAWVRLEELLAELFGHEEGGHEGAGVL